MKAFLALFRWVHTLTALLFAAASLALIALAARTGWLALSAGLDGDAALQIIESVGLLAAAVVALQIAETIIEEEVIRDKNISAPTRVRRFLSRFFVVVTVALAVEGLVAVFKAIHEDMEMLPYASTVVGSTGLLLVAWGAFIWFNRAAEDVEPEAMEEAKQEDEKLG
jgi:hypothetical protein